MFQVEVDSEFSAVHSLKLYDGTYEPRHGHDFKVRVLMESEGLDPIGVVTDFEALKPLLKNVLAEFHEISINEHPDFREKLNPSTENIAKVIGVRLKSKFRSPTVRLKKVTVWETPDASASYYV